ncbi:MAG: transcriptional repressor [Chloroflexota bacterium]|nr:transcriptional repressor [Chloroflexota bacterium]
MIATLRQRGIRVTAQRLAVAEVLANSTDHPSAQDVYERVRQHVPHITRATVYNTLNVLSEKGLVQPLHFRLGTRYDANPLLHANLICVKCSSITDARIDEDGAVASLRETLTRASGFQVMGQRLDFYGVCPRCAGSSASQRMEPASGQAVQPGGRQAPAAGAGGVGH